MSQRAPQADMEGTFVRNGMVGFVIRKTRRDRKIRGGGEEQKAGTS